jgi:hypothetical protein
MVPKKSILHERLFFIALLLVQLLPALALAQVTIPRQDPGPRLIDGNIINQLIDRLSGSGTAAQPTLCTATGASPQTCNGYRGTITTAVLALGTLVSTTYTVNNNLVFANSVVSCDYVTMTGGTIITQGIPTITQCLPAAGSLTVVITNTGLNAMNAGAATPTVTFQFVIFN